MNPCKRVGIDVTWRCNWKCKHCFYLRNPKFHSKEDVPVSDIKRKIQRAYENGLDQVVFVGYGEPAFYPHTPEILDFAHSLNMTTSMITNGTAKISVYEDYFNRGMDHLHISSHGLGETLDKIVGVEGAFAKQAELKEWLHMNQLPFRTNVTLQKDNYEELISLAEYEVSKGVSHFVFLGFLPHYEWHQYVGEIAVHPAQLRPYIEASADHLINRGIPFTIRYHPLCHLSPEYWKYVVNARYVFFDPWEWNYTLQVRDVNALWEASKSMGEGIACRTPCNKCKAYKHCGGWNRRNTEPFGGPDACLKPITECPPCYGEDAFNRDGGLHDLNPANSMSGILKTS